MVQSYTGHSDVVRDIAVVSEKLFLSASNDSTIRLWEFAGACARMFSGHSSYIYRIALTPNGFASVGEDSCVKVCIMTRVRNSNTA